MLLKRLADYAERLESTPIGYQQKPVRYLITLTAKGEYLHLIDCSNGPKDPGLPMLVPLIKRTNKLFPYLLADHAGYIFGLPHKDGARRAAGMHQTFLDLVARCVQATQEPSVLAVLTFLQALKTTDLHLPDGFDPSATITFEVDGVRPIELPSVQEYWAQTVAADADGQVMECLVCGQSRPAVRILPIAIKGIPAGQSTGMALTSANKGAFHSYGLEDSFVASTCEICSERFSRALNALLKDERTRVRLSPLIYIFWTKEAESVSFVPTLKEAKPEDVLQLFASVRTGDAYAAEADTTSFYSACLSAHGPRVVVRDWLETTLAEASQHLMRYFLLQHVLDVHGQEQWFPLWQLVKATVSMEAKEDPSPLVGQSLVHLALHGGSLPLSLLNHVLIRLRAERIVRPAQAALIKMILLSQPAERMPLAAAFAKGNEQSMADLENTNDSPAYQCGRLLAMLEKIQREALGPNLSSTITDRYYGTASTAPALVFARLLRGAQAHLTGLRAEKDKGNLFAWLERDLQEILETFKAYGNCFPTTLTLIDQGIFALGYHHQKFAMIRAAMARQQQKNGASLPSSPDGTREAEGTK